jgi:hypothetical protein
MDLFAFRRPCPVECGAYSSGVSGKQKKDNPLRSLRLCGELLPLFGWTAEGCAGVYRLFRFGYNHR